MTSPANAGTLTDLWRFPVKSMRGERLEGTYVTPHGLRGDRAFALLDTETGKVASAKSVNRFPDLFACQASFVEQPSEEGELPPVRITLPDGTCVLSDAPDVNDVLSKALGRAVTLASVPPEDFATDQYHPDLEHLDPAGYRDTVVEQKLGASFFAKAGISSPVPKSSFLDLFPVSLITSSTLEHLHELAPDSNFDPRRFRMNLNIRSEGKGFIENGWLGKKLRVGENLTLNVIMPDPRCVMTTLPMEDLPRDTNVLRTIAQHNRLTLGPSGAFPCAGVYAVVTTPGVVRVGSEIRLV